MRSIRQKVLSIGLILGVLSGLPRFVHARSGVPNWRHVFIVWLENTDYEAAKTQPFLARLAQEGAALTNFHGETHPSLPNYIAFAGGDLLGVHSNGSVSLTQSHIGNLVEAAGKSWKTYAEGVPGPCFLGDNFGSYARRHNPLINFRDVQTNPSRCARVTNDKEMDADIAKGTLPDLVLYIPDVRNDGHDTGVKFADNWLNQRFSPLLKNRTFADSTLFIVTFDESGPSPTNHIYTSFWGESIKPGSTSNQHLNHYNMLRTIQEGWNLETLSRQDAKAYPIQGIWK